MACSGQRPEAQQRWWLRASNQPHGVCRAVLVVHAEWTSQFRKSSSTVSHLLLRSVPRASALMTRSPPRAGTRVVDGICAWTTDAVTMINDATFHRSRISPPSSIVISVRPPPPGWGGGGSRPAITRRLTTNSP
jgi:hypothetical protein